jgi:hypothetical protein
MFKIAILGVILEGLLVSYIRMMWLLKSQFDQNLIMINHKSNGNFNNHIIFSRTQIGHK